MIFVVLMKKIVIAVDCRVKVAKNEQYVVRKRCAAQIKVTNWRKTPLLCEQSQHRQQKGNLSCQNEQKMVDLYVFMT